MASEIPVPFKDPIPDQLANIRDLDRGDVSNYLAQLAVDPDFARSTVMHRLYSTNQSFLATALSQAQQAGEIGSGPYNAYMQGFLLWAGSLMSHEVADAEKQFDTIVYGGPKSDDEAAA